MKWWKKKNHNWNHEHNVRWKCRRAYYAVNIASAARIHAPKHTHQYTPNLCWTTLKKLSLLNLVCVCFGWTHGWFKVKPSLMKFYTSVSYFIKNLLKSIRIYLFYTLSMCVCVCFLASSLIRSTGLVCIFVMAWHDVWVWVNLCSFRRFRLPLKCTIFAKERERAFAIECTYIFGYIYSL